jgi:RHS repeat-associated protein
MCRGKRAAVELRNAWLSRECGTHGGGGSPRGRYPFVHRTFVYDGVGNVKALVRSSTDQDVYVYDLVSRLVYARFKTAGGGIKEESLSYDAFGNLLSSVSTDYGSRSWSVDGVNRLAGCGYDAAGRMTACGGLTLSWTGAGELGKVQGTGINRSFLYTASGEKVMVRNELLGTAAVSLRDLGGNPVRHYLYSGGSWSWLGDDIFLGRLRIAQVNGSGTRYFHVDHLGSVRRVSTGAGALEKAYDFFPYGLPVKETVGQERLWFGGYELEHQNTPDYTDDLYFLHARWYFPYMGRFLSPDPVRGDPAQPQSFNLYAYVRGNPLNAVDPDGRAALWLTPSRERAMAMAASGAEQFSRMKRPIGELRTDRAITREVPKGKELLGIEGLGAAGGIARGLRRGSWREAGAFPRRFRWRWRRGQWRVDRLLGAWPGS